MEDERFLTLEGVTGGSVQKEIKLKGARGGGRVEKLSVALMDCLRFEILFRKIGCERLDADCHTHIVFANLGSTGCGGVVVDPALLLLLVELCCVVGGIIPGKPSGPAEPMLQTNDTVLDTAKNF